MIDRYRIPAFHHLFIPTDPSEPGSFDFDTSAGRPPPSTQYTILNSTQVTASKNTKSHGTVNAEELGLKCKDCYARSKGIGFKVNQRVRVKDGKISYGDIDVTGGISMKLEFEVNGKG